MPAAGGAARASLATRRCPPASRGAGPSCVGGAASHPPCSLQSNYDFVYPTAPGKLFAPPPDKKGVLTEAALLSQVLLPPSVPMPDGSTVSGWSFFKGAFTVGFDFRILPALRPEQQLLNAYTNAWQPPAGCPVAGALAAAAATLNSRLRAISTAIQAREAPLITTLPQFTLLDPAQMPYFTYT